MGRAVCSLGARFALQTCPVVLRSLGREEAWQADALCALGGGLIGDIRKAGAGLAVRAVLRHDAGARYARAKARYGCIGAPFRTRLTLGRDLVGVDGACSGGAAEGYRREDLPGLLEVLHIKIPV